MVLERFQKNQRVIFQTGGKWFEGKILGVLSRDSYRVQEYEQFCDSMGGGEPPMNKPGKLYTLTSEDIKVLPKEKSIMDRMFESLLKVPIFEDPFAHMYMKDDEHKAEIPEEQWRGIIDETEDIYEIVKLVHNRREVVEGGFGAEAEGGYGLEAVNVLQTLKSILPEDRDMIRLEERAKTDTDAMLQLADAYRFGLLGVNKDRVKSLRLYLCAAWGVSLKEMDEYGPYDPRFSYPMGSLEGMCACAQEMWKNISGQGIRSFEMCVVEMRDRDRKSVV